MNQNFPLGPMELVGAGTIAREILTIRAVGANVVLASVVFMHPAAPANAAATAACTLAPGDFLNNVKSCTISSGVAQLVYRK
jgi:hypothetical protein